MDRLRKLIDFLSPYLKNWYVVTSLVFCIWMLVFDRHNLISQVRERRKLNQLKEDQAYFTKENEANRVRMKELMSDPENLEKFAREQYLMKKDNEDVFVIVEE
ncbi:MAG: septum formation initiator family protein [Flavobacteriales bacterium]|nr:septum formation initiator family protein [Flavobacteriales bacterium]